VWIALLLSGVHAGACADPVMSTAVAPPAAMAAAEVLEPGDGEAWLAVQLDPREPAQNFLALKRGGRWLVRGEDLRRWRLRLPETEPLMRGEDAWYPLDAMPGLAYSVDAATQTMSMDIPAGLYDPSLVAERPDYLDPTPSPPGGFLNYDVAAERRDGQTHTNALLEMGAFKASGSLLGTFLAGEWQDGLRLKRLDTTWTQDRPAARTSLRLGDAISGTTGWARSVRFGGVQWATNFDTQPTLVTYPQPGIAGEAALPSTVDLYINDALRSRQEVPAGPFTLQDLPVMTGQGEMSLVVRDVLGRERVISAPYYASPRLLRAGLHDYSYEMGFVRRDYGLSSNGYGRFLAVGTHRLGLSDRLTGEAHAELQRDQQTFGLGGVMLWPGAGVVNASLAASHGDGGDGGLVALGFQRQARVLSFGGNLQFASRRFRQLGLGSVRRWQGGSAGPGGYAPDQDASYEEVDRQVPRVSSQLFVSLATRGQGSFGLSHVRQDYRDEADIELFSANYSIGIGNLGFLSAALLRTLAPRMETSLSLLFTLPLGDRRTASIGTRREGGDQQATVRLQRNLPTGSGYGYRLLAAVGEPSRGEAGVSMQNDVGTYSLEAARYAGKDGVRASARGGVVALDGSAYLSRHVDDSFAVVKLPGYPDVRVYADNRLVARTDEDGNALLPGLRPYQKNPVRIEQADLPMDAEIDAIALDAIPYGRSGVLLAFPIRRSRGATLTILLEDGRPLPAGAEVHVAGQAQGFPVGQRGQAYLTGLSEHNRLAVTWRGQHCVFDATLPLSGDALPDMGRFLCIGVVP